MVIKFDNKLITKRSELYMFQGKNFLRRFKSLCICFGTLLCNFWVTFLCLFGSLVGTILGTFKKRFVFFGSFQITLFSNQFWKTCCPCYICFSHFLSLHFHYYMINSTQGYQSTPWAHSVHTQRESRDHSENTHSSVLRNFLTSEDRYHETSFPNGFRIVQGKEFYSHEILI